MSGEPGFAWGVWFQDRRGEWRQDQVRFAKTPAIKAARYLATIHPRVVVEEYDPLCPSSPTVVWKSRALNAEDRRAAKAAR